MFVSLVGTQIMAVLNPLLALLQTKKAIDPVYLIHTQETKDLAEKIKGYCNQNHPSIKIFLKPASSTLDVDSQGFLPCQEIFREIPSQEENPIIFNLAGGMNFQIPPSIAARKSEDIQFVYPEDEGIYFYQKHQGKWVEEALNEPKIVPVLDLQGLPYTVGPQPHRLSLGRITLDKEKVMKNVLIEEICFHWVWNRRNVMNFLYMMNDLDPLLEQIRRIVSLVNDRKKVGDLLHKHVYIVGRKGQVSERVEMEGQGRVHFLKGENNQEIHTRIANLILGQVPKKTSVQLCIKEIQTGRKNGWKDEASLFMAVGSDISATLVALWTHRPREAHLIFTPDSPEVQRNINGLREHASQIPCEKLFFYSVGLTGYELLNYPKKAKYKIKANITPGTKAQGAFLSIFASANNGSIWSIENTKNLLSCSVPAENSICGLKSPDPVLYQKFRGENVDLKGMNKVQILNEKWRFEPMFLFFQHLSMNLNLLKKFPTQRIDINNGEFRFFPPNNRNNATLCYKNRKIPWNFFQNLWFENFVGYILTKCDADDVQTRLRFRWSQAIEATLRREYHNPQRTDLDVVARFGNKYFGVSCKAGKASVGLTGERARTLRDEIKATSFLFGRFAVSLIAHLHYWGKPVSIENPDRGDKGVVKFGIQTLTDIESLKKLLADTLKEKRIIKDKNS